MDVILLVVDAETDDSLALKRSRGILIFNVNRFDTSYINSIRSYLLVEEIEEGKLNKVMSLKDLLSDLVVNNTICCVNGGARCPDFFKFWNHDGVSMIQCIMLSGPADGASPHSPKPVTVNK